MILQEAHRADAPDDRGHPHVPAHQPLAPADVPVHANLLAVRGGSDPEVRAAARGLAGAGTDLPLPSVPSRRMRPGPLNVGHESNSTEAEHASSPFTGVDGLPFAALD